MDMLKFSSIVFAITEQVSTTLQSKNLTAQEAIKAVGMTIECFNRQRNELSFDDVYQKTIEGLTQPPSLPRVCKAPKRFDSNVHHIRFLYLLTFI